MNSREPRELVALEKAAQMLASAESFEDIKSIRDAAIAAQAYAKAARRGLETQNRVAVVRIQAERKAGKYLAGLKLRGGDRKSESRRRRAPMTLESLGVTRDESKRWQKEASVSEKVFQRYVATSNQLGQEVSSAGLIRLARGYLSVRNGNGHGTPSRPAPVQRNGGFRSAPVPRPAVTRQVEVVAINGRPNRSSKTRQLIREIENHRQLLVSILTPICANADEKLKLVERKHLKYLLSEIEKGLKRLNDLV